MGYMRDHTIVLSHWDDEDLDKIRDKAVEIFGEDRVSPMMGPYTNCHVSFFIPPDGSKEGWDESKEGDARRSEFKDFIRKSKLYCNWAEVVFGDDEQQNEVIDHN